MEAKAYINPEIAEQHNAKGGELFKAGTFPAALKEFEEAIKRNPKEAKYYCNKATSLMKLMAFNEAITDLNKCLEIDANYIKAYVKKGKHDHNNIS
jgi:stress-induced-phosphoprotein 1